MQVLKGRDFEMVIVLTNCHSDIDISGITDFICYFYTKDTGAAIERSKDQFTWDETGTIGTTILTGIELNGLEDGVLRYQFEADGQIVKRTTNYYIKTPVDFSGQTYTTEEDVERIVAEAVSGITSGSGLECYRITYQNKRQIAQSIWSRYSGLTAEELNSKVRLIYGDAEMICISKTTDPDQFNFYCSEALRNYSDNYYQIYCGQASIGGEGEPYLHYWGIPAPQQFAINTTDRTITNQMGTFQPIPLHGWRSVVMGVADGACFAASVDRENSGAATNYSGMNSTNVEIIVHNNTASGGSLTIKTGEFYSKTDNATIKASWTIDYDSEGSGITLNYWEPVSSGTPVSVEQTLSAGTKIAEITVDGSGTSIYAPTAQGGGDYMVVSQLPATAETGQMFFVPAHTEVLSGTVLDASSVIENYCGNFRTTGGTDLGAFYHSADAFHWDFDNSGNVAKRDANGYYYYYRIDAANSLFYFVPIDEMILTPSNGATTAETQNAMTRSVPDTTYRYTGSGYEVVPQAKNMYFLNNMTQGELADLYAAISGITSGNTQSSNIPELLKNYEFYVAWEVDGQKWCPAYFTNWENGSELWISGIKPSKASYPLSVMRTTAAISADGSVRWIFEETPNFNNLANDLTIMVDSAGTINTEHLGDFSNLAKMNRFALHYAGDDNMYAMSPVDYFYRQMENINGEDKLVEYIGGKIEISGITYQGAWHFNEWGWGDRVQPDKWEVYNPVMSQQINNIWTGTRQQYSAQTISNTTLYFLTD